jgi:leucyl/phenylalanyl-tRNA--protein transferase
MYFLTKELYFPPCNLSSEDGLLAVGGDLCKERLWLAYQNGIFPWFENGDPILWWSPPKRMVLFPKEFRPSKSMRNVINQKKHKVTFNTAFTEVMKNCQQIEREGQDGTWINNEMIDSYTALFREGKAMSVEVWQDNVLVGGLYGITVFPVFCGESMFAKVSNASKLAFVALVEFLNKNNYQLLDAQLHNSHLESLGCKEIERSEFLKFLKK